MLSLVYQSIDENDEICNVLIHGLTEKDVQELRGGEIILLDGSSLGMPKIKIAICVGGNEDDIKRSLEENLQIEFPEQMEEENYTLPLVDLLDENETKH